MCVILWNIKCFVPVFLVHRVTIQQLFFDMRGVKVHVYLGGAQVFMSKHILDCAKVGSALEQVGGKAVSEGVWGYFFGYTSLCGISLDEDKK